MNDTGDGYRDPLKHKRFVIEIEQSIRAANSEIIHKRIPELSRDKILSFSVAVGRLRARYLAAAINLSVNEAGEPPDKAFISDLTEKREMYEESLAAFDALLGAIEKGYIDIEELD
ncbi:MAG: hypothetical protein HQ503_17085 [Rhodospirillales bacterium]|nr:hypothetical protein [Rhodospirillales bacterium]